jgi:mRNA interferase HigB
MVIVTRKHLQKAAQKHKEAASELYAWFEVVSRVRWRSFHEVRATFPDADMAGGYVIFNIRHNRYRLITVIHYAKEQGERRTQGHCYIRSFLTHKEYDNPANWDKEFGS